MVETCHLWQPKHLPTPSIVIVLHIVDPHVSQDESKISISQNPILLACGLITSFHQTDVPMRDLEGRFEDNEAPGSSGKNNCRGIWYSTPYIMGVLILDPGFVGVEEQGEAAVGFLQGWAERSLGISLSCVTSDCTAFTKDGLLTLLETAWANSFRLQLAGIDSFV